MKSQALVLLTRKYNDEAIIAEMLTSQAGCVAFWIRTSKSKRTAIPRALLQPLALLEVEWNEKPSAQLQKPKAVQNLFPFTSIPFNPHKTAICLFLSEFLHHAIKNEPDTTTIFQFCAQSLQWLDTCQTGFANFHLVFLLRLTRFLGFAPNIEHFQPGHYFDLQASCFSPTKPTHNNFLEPQDAQLLPQLLRMKYANMHLFRFNGTARSQLLAHILTYYRLHIPGFPELNSPQIMRLLFA